MLAKYIYLGIDPGASGGIAVINGKEITAIAMPCTEEDTWEALKYQTEYMKVEKGEVVGQIPVFATIEKVGGFIGIPHPGSAMFKFGMSYGGLRMALVAALIPFEEVTPQKWQKGLGIATRSKKESKTQFKNRLRSKAQQLFPGMKITLAVADALLIAEYCRRKREGKL